jgi:hypothetical protein
LQRLGGGAARHALDVFADDDAVPDLRHVIDHDGGAFLSLLGNRGVDGLDEGAGAAEQLAHPAAEGGAFGGGVAVAARSAGALLVPAAVGFFTRRSKIIVRAD